MAKKITYTNKQQSQSLPGIPSNQKWTFQNANEVKQVMNEQYERLVLDWASDISDNDVLPIALRVEYNNIIYKVTTSYDVGSPKTFTSANFQVISGGSFSTLGTFDPSSAISMATSGSYDAYTTTGNVSLSFTGGVEGTVRTVKITFDGTHTLTLPPGTDNFSSTDVFSGSGQAPSDGTYELIMRYRNSSYSVELKDVTGLEAGGGTGIFEPVQDITALKALDTTTAADWPDKWAILVEDEGQFYRLDRDSAVSESLPRIVAPTTGVGRWIRDQDVQLTGKADKESYASLTPSASLQLSFVNYFNKKTLTLDQNIDITFSSLTGKVGYEYRLVIIQNATGGYEISSFPTEVDWGDLLSPVFEGTADQREVEIFFEVESTTKVRGSYRYLY
jgi:hypothetical protein